MLHCVRVMHRLAQGKVERLLHHGSMAIAENHDVKVAILDGKKFYYPDVFFTKGERNQNNQHIKTEPEIIVEVVSETTQGYRLC